MKAIKIFGFLLVFFIKGNAQNANNKDQNNVNSKNETLEMMADSSIVFLKEADWQRQ